MKISWYREATRRHLKDIEKRIQELKHIIDILKKIEITSILDFGCSSGYLLEKLNYEQKYGYEVDNTAIELAKSKGLFVTSNWDEIPRVDCITVIDVVEHFEYQELIDWIQKWHKKLNERGYLFIETDNPHCLRSFIFFYDDFTHKRMYGEISLTNLIEMNGFKKIDSGKAVKLLYGFRWKIFKWLKFPFTLDDEYGKYWILAKKI